VRAGGPLPGIAAGLLVVLLSSVLGGCQPQGGEAEVLSYGFRDPQRVEIAGYDGDAMEPFISRDDRWLFFNNRNTPDVDTDLFYAESTGGGRFRFRGEVLGANSEALDAVASMDRSGRFYFITTRSYWQDLATIYSGRFENGRVTDVRRVAGNIRPPRPGLLNMDQEISPDGETLWFAPTVRTRAPVPVASNLAIAVRRGEEFVLAERSNEILARVNTNALEYAPSISADGLELFFTRKTKGLAIYQARRSARGEPFGEPERIAAIAGFVEAPSITADGRTLYYHRRGLRGFRIYRVIR
jgi:Tol biopolymer transport system component